MKCVFYGQVLKEVVFNSTPADYLFSGLDYMVDTELLYKMRDKPHYFVVTSKVHKNYKQLKEISDLERCPEVSERIIINNKECFIRDKKQDVDDNKMHYYTDYPLRTIPLPKEEKDRAEAKLIQVAEKEILRREKLYLKKKWYEFWK